MLRTTARGPRAALFALGLLAVAPPALAADKPKVPDAFDVRLVATVPAVQYPCQVGTGPGGQLFVAEDPMDQTGPYEAFNGRILRFVNDRDPVEFADKLRAVQGMAWHDGSLYVCHMPFLTVFKDTDGDGKADQRKDLFTDLGPTNNQGLNDHIVSGLQFGMDGWLYISVGDKGIPKATGPDGRTVQIKGGGSVRCRPDGTGIEVFTTGTRNHLEVNLDDRDNAFTYDNTDDGLGWWTRVTHHVDGGYYGYAYDYHTRPDRFLNRMAEYGGGSPCGAAFARDDAWPEKYRGMGYWAEWGKGKVQAIRFKEKGATFEVAEMVDFAVPAGVENFRPIDLAFSEDGGTLYVADWGMGGWGSKTEKVGRVWAIAPKDAPAPRSALTANDDVGAMIQALGDPSYSNRMRAQNLLIARGGDTVGPVAAALADADRDPVARRHLIWTLDGLAGGTPEATVPILAQLRAKESDLRAQAARALGLRRVAVATEGLVALLKDQDPGVRLQALIALGRIGDEAAIASVAPLVADSDPYVAFAARQALRRINQWNLAANAGLKADDAKVRLGVLSAMDEQYDLQAAGQLLSYAMGPDHPSAERAKALQYAAGLHRKAKPWDGRWWGTQPAAGKPPAKELAWEATPAIVETVHLALADSDPAMRLAAISAVEEMKDETALALLRKNFATEPDEAVKRQIAATLGALKDREALPVLTAAMKDPNAPESTREAALGAVEAIGTEAGATALADLLRAGGLPAEREPRVLAAIGKFGVKSALPIVLEKLASPSAPTRAAAARAVAGLKTAEGAGPRVRELLADPDLAVRQAAAEAVGALGDRESIPALLGLADRQESRFEATKALALMPDARALNIYVRGLTERNGEIRKASGSALAAIRDEVAPALDRLAARKELPPSAISELAKIYTTASPIARWQVVGPFLIDDPAPFATSGPVDLKATYHGPGDKSLNWGEHPAIDDRGQVDVNRIVRNAPDDRAVYAYAEIDSPAARKANFLAGSDDTLTVWVNGKQVYDFSDRRGWDPEAARFEADLVAGKNAVLIKCGNRGGPWQFSVAVSAPAEYAFLKAPAANAFDPEAYLRFALRRPGDPEKGKALFADLKGLACIKCHALQGQGGQVGPDLSDLGLRYPKDEIARSVLYPSAKIFSGYEPVVVAMEDGRVLTGIVKAEDDEALEILDAEANRVRIPKAEIEEKKVSDISLMPNGLADGLSREDFADLIGYLQSLKEKPQAKP